MSFAVARQVVGSAFFNTFNIPTVEIRFQRSPGNNQSFLKDFMTRSPAGLPRRWTTSSMSTGRA